MHIYIQISSYSCMYTWVKSTLYHMDTCISTAIERERQRNKEKTRKERKKGKKKERKKDLVTDIVKIEIIKIDG